jgi:hypothetical protein
MEFVSQQPDPIDDEEFLLRRIPVSTSWYSTEHGLAKEAFAPHQTRDLTGLSLTRMKYRSPEEDARAGTNPKGYYVAILRVKELRSAGISVEARPEPNNPGHVELPALRSANRKSTECLELEQRLATELTIRVEGPFPNSSQLIQ